MKLQTIFIALLSCLLVTGCTHFIVPEIGSVAEEDNRVAYVAGAPQTGVLDTKDLIFKYTLSENENGLLVTGDLAFDRSLTDSFPSIKTFFLKISWLDADGHVLETVDVSPGYNYLGRVPNKLKVNKQISNTSGSSSFVFNYYGVFQGEKPDVSEEWDIHLFPFTTP